MAMCRMLVGVCEGAVSVASVADENGILGNDKGEVGSERGGPEVGQVYGRWWRRCGRARSERSRAPQSRALPFSPCRRAFSALTTVPLRPLRRLEDEGLVRFHDAGDSRCLRAFVGRQEPMPPTKRCFEMDADALCCLSQAQPVDDGAGILEPLLTLLQVRQRRAGERRGRWRSQALHM